MAGKHWTPEEIERLRIMWSSVGRYALLEAFPGRSYEALRRKAQLGLKLGDAHIRGTEFITKVAREHGFDGGSIRVFRRIMRWAGVEIHGHGRRYRTVDPGEAAEAMERWEKDAETLYDAWLRHDVEFRTVKKALIVAGLLHPKHFRRGDRFLRTEVDRAIAEYKSSKESIREAAKRLNVAPVTLMRALWRAGVIKKRDKKRGPKAALVPGQADRALAEYQKSRDPRKVRAQACRSRS